jgi:hypothetical protein
MNDTQSLPEPDRPIGEHTEPGDPVAEIADADPAQAPDLAERYAAELEADLEESGPAPPTPQQIEADLGDGA